MLLGSGLSTQVGASVAALAFPVIGPAGVVAIRQWVAAIVRDSARQVGRERPRVGARQCCQSGRGRKRRAEH